jgi:exodeoxyribonuclease V beta subunit
VSTPTEFAVFDCPLDGVNLIEASAGTGKTWNVCGLYLRLLLERGFDVRQILVVTFTNAATAELRERIRARIVETLDWLRGGDAGGPSGDPFVARLVATAEDRTGATRAQLAAVLDQALQYFDEAAIHTIHGFCQRALADAAFSAGLPLTLELVADDSELVLEAVHDFWRRRVADDSCPPELASYLLERKDSPDAYARLLRRSLAKPLARHLWPADLDAPAAVDATALTAPYRAARDAWAAERAAIVDLVKNALPGLNKQSYKVERIERAAATWDAYFRSAAPLAASEDDALLELLASSRLKKGTNKNQVTPTHAFFAAADTLLAARAAMKDVLALARLRLIRDLIVNVGPELQRRKRERRVVSFDDMLHNLHAALTDGGHPGLVESLREKLPVALIDEFQDTDPLQFGIFDRIYRQGQLPAFYVGDPKQAIYSFRNADLHAYLAARKATSAEYTLAENQRSTAGLIDGLNGLFGANRRAFVLPDLDFRPVRKGKRERERLVDTSRARAELQVWTLPTAEDGRPIDKKSASAAAARATAAEIARLVAEAAAGRIRVGDRPLRPADVAVLVRTHAQGSAMKRALAGLDVGSVELAQASIFRSVDAEEVERVLLAICEPSREALLRGALATEMMGCDADRIAEISGSETLLLQHLERFAGYRDVWLRQGVGVMYRRLLAEEKVSARMLCGADGERRLTNLLHLGELLHQAAASHASPDALLRWLAAQRRDESTDDVAQLRLESDRNLVRIVTIHKAKGLEFPIVFAPFAWEGRTRFGNTKPEGREYHDEGGTVVIDFRADDEIGEPAKKEIDGRVKREEAAEALRLLYVALTRAMHRCYLIAGRYRTGGKNGSDKESRRSPLDWLVAGDGATPEGWFDSGSAPPDGAAAWDALAARLAPQLGIAPLPDAPGTPVTLPGPAAETLAALPPPKSIAAQWRIGSFSSIVGDARAEGAANDHDARVADSPLRRAAPPMDLAADDILRFPRGTSAGECLHAVFERIDFTDPAGWTDAVGRALFLHPQALPGVRASEQTSLLAGMARSMLADVIRTTLPGGITLGSIPATCRLVELEFSLPSPRVSTHVLSAALKEMGYDAPRLAGHDLDGYLKGFIDLVFEHGGRYYVVDWKSNHLGYAPADYAPAALQVAMAEHGYHLQYLLYALAVDRYLRHRVPGYRHDTHFGGVHYLFVRGVRPDWINADGTPAGVFSHRPTAAKLARLDALFSRPNSTGAPRA